MSSAGVRLSASKRIFVSEVIHISLAAARTPYASRDWRGVGSRQISASAKVSGLWTSLDTRLIPGTWARMASNSDAGAHPPGGRSCDDIESLLLRRPRSSHG
jgi:hypothetical protein